MHGMTNAHLARWLGRQLADPMPQLNPARLFGLVVNDPAMLGSSTAGGGAAGAVRFIAIADGDPYVLLAGPAAIAAGRYDALALVAIGSVSSRHIDHLGRSHPRTVAIVVALSLGAEPGYYVWDVDSGEVIDGIAAAGDLPAAVDRLRSTAA